ncbi:MAG: pyridoxamine 5'-phosphate oxidase family protein [Chitinophagales bacterium]
MLGELRPNQIEILLNRQFIGRIGCSANGITYIVPVAYAYDGKYIYAHSKEGRKIQMMRMNPLVCFEVDQMEGPANWQCVIVWGKYEELKGNDQKMGLHHLITRLQAGVTSETSIPSTESSEGHQNDIGAYKSIIFRIEIKEKTGRFERR